MGWLNPFDSSRKKLMKLLQNSQSHDDISTSAGKNNAERHDLVGKASVKDAEIELLRSINDNIIKRNAMLLEALEWYADENNIAISDPMKWKARSALQQKDSE